MPGAICGCEIAFRPIKNKRNAYGNKFNALCPFFRVRYNWMDQQYPSRCILISPAQGGLLFPPDFRGHMDVGRTNYFTILIISLNLSPSAVSSSSNRAVSTLVKLTPESLIFCKPISLSPAFLEDTASVTT